MITPLRSHILDKYGVTARGAGSARDFARNVETIRQLMTGFNDDASGFPLYGAHINPDHSYIAPHCFQGVVGIRDDGMLVTTNTARLYEFDGKKTLRWLFESCRLWYDEPEIHAPFMRCDVQSTDPRMDRGVSAAIHVGTAWVHPSLRGNGLGKAMVALHRLEAIERLGDHLMFGTTIAGKSGGFTGRPRDGEKAKFDGTATVCMFAPGDPNGIPEVQHVRIWNQSDILSAAERVLATAPQT